MGIQVSELIQNAGARPWVKEFIDFEFDGKNITDFGLVVTFGGDRLSVSASPKFEDETSTVNGVPGQLYWGTRYGVLEQTFTLATDGMTEQQLQAFKAHFQPGKYGKFVEPQYPGRYSYCRISDIGSFEVVPFRVESTFMGQKLMINEYKGDITITFTWDEPFYYSENNYAATTVGEIALKTIYNNQLPSFWEGAAYPDKTISICCIGDSKILGAEGNVLEADQDILYYNPSTIDKPPTELFIQIQPQFSTRDYSSWKPVYFTGIADEFNSPSCPYNDIRITDSRVISSKANSSITLPTDDDFEVAFKYSSPNVIYSVQRAIQIAWNLFSKTTNQSIIDLEKALREEITHKNVIAWAVKVLGEIKEEASYCANGILQKSGKKSISGFPGDTTSSFSGSWFAYFNIEMWKFFYGTLDDGTTGFSPFLFVIYGETHSATVSYVGHNSSGNEYNFSEEKCGDITRSSYLLLKGGDTLASDGSIHTAHFIRFRTGGKVASNMKVALFYKYCYI